MTKLMVVYDFVSYLAERDLDQAWFWTPAGQAGERAADEDLQSGNYEDFDNMDDLITALNREKVITHAHTSPANSTSKRRGSAL